MRRGASKRGPSIYLLVGAYSNFQTDAHDMFSQCEQGAVASEERARVWRGSQEIRKRPPT